VTALAIERSDDFTDDSSSTLSLDHRAASGALPGPRRLSAVGGIERHFAPQEIEARRIQQQLLDKRIRELHAEGHTIKQATELARQEFADPKVLKPVEDREAKHVREIEHLMGADMDVDGGSSGSKSKYKQRKTGTHVCPNCYLEGCQCYVGPGRPFMGGRGRTEDVSCKVTSDARTQLRDDKISAGAVVEAIVERAQELGIGVPDYLASIGVENVEQLTTRLQRPAMP
jgi:hypothetical protein